jgi:hypothetical protein
VKEKRQFVPMPQSNLVAVRNISSFRNPAPEFSIAPDVPGNSSLTNRELTLLIMFVLSAFGIIVFCIGYLVLKLIRNKAEDDSELALDMLNKHSPSMSSSINNINSTNSSSIYAKKKPPPLRNLKTYAYNRDKPERAELKKKPRDLKSNSEESEMNF